MDVGAVRQAIATAADVIAGLVCTGYVPDAVTEPHFYAGEVVADFDKAFRRGLDDIHVTCRVLVGRQDDRAGQALLDTYLSGSGANSLKAAIEADPTLGGLCHAVHVTRVHGHRLYLVGDRDYFGAELTVRVIGSG